MGGVWKAYSASKSFTLAAPTTGFDSEFTSDAAGWTPLNGSWSVSGGSYHTPGLTDEFTTSKHSSNYNVLTYEVKLERTGCVGCSYGIFFNGAPSPITSTGRWNNGYGFYISNDSYTTIGMYQSGVWTALLPWTSYSISTSWNTLKVTYNSSNGFVQFYINGTRIAHGTFSTFTSGQVGVGVYRDSTAGTFYVDYAKLSMSAPTAILAGDSLGSGGGFVLDEAKGVKGGSDLVSP